MELQSINPTLDNAEFKDLAVVDRVLKAIL